MTACPHTDQVQRHERLLMGNGTPESGLAFRLYRLEAAAKWVFGVASASVVAIVGLIVERFLGG